MVKAEKVSKKYDQNVELACLLKLVQGQSRKDERINK
jgi:hypothetical protein